MGQDLLCNRLGGVEMRAKVHIWETADVPGGPNPAARFVFKYRSLGELAAMKILNGSRALERHKY